MSHSFARVPKADIQRSVFDRSCGYKTTFNGGLLIPFYVDEYLPGDTFNVNATLFARLNTPIVPIMDNMYLTTFFFAIPNRIIWTNFVKMMGEQDDPGDSIAYTTPQIVMPAGGPTAETLFDYFGIPIGADSNALSISALPSRAYNLVWNEWFRDQNLQDSVVVDKDDGPDTYTDYVLLRRGKRHDYFTSCLPWAQKGTASSFSMTGDAPITGIGKGDQNWGAGISVYETDGTGTTAYTASRSISGNNAQETFYAEEDPNNAGFPNFRADLTGASGITINDLRESIAVQRLLEKSARSGTRYTEIVQAHFGVTSDDARLQRPEYLGGGSAPVHINEVPQTSETNTTAQGTLSATGRVGITRGFQKSFTEHGIILGLCCVDADLTYQKGLDRMWSRSDRYDYYQPEFANLGEQAVLNKEIYVDMAGTPTDTFGYQERYAEYRYKPSKITGKLNSHYATPLDTWHLSEEFGSQPALNSTFIVSDPPIDRIVAVNTEPDFTLDCYIQNKTVRPMPVYAIPGLNRL